MSAKTKKPSGLYLMHVSIHGLIRSNTPEIGVDADTGGQTKYVLDLTRRLGDTRGVRRFDLLTRKIIDPNVSEDYARPFEEVTQHSQIVRLSCGPDKYIQKEMLWPHLQEFVDNALRYIRAQGEVPDVIHGHYADGAFAATRIAKVLGIPLIYTAHSLGRFKRKRLLADGMTARRAQGKFHFQERIEAEEETLENAELVIASTNDEVENQYAKYDHYNTSTMRILPPGCDIEAVGTKTPPVVKQEFDTMRHRFLSAPNKPALIMIARPDIQKNIFAALHAFGKSDLRKHANLFLFIGLREDLETMHAAQHAVFTELLKLIDLYDLYGSVAYPKHHTPEMVSALYRHAHRTGGVLLAPSRHENFGLTLVEAAAAGVPVISSGAGGMSDVLKNCGHGIIADPDDPDAFAQAIVKCIADEPQWHTLSSAGRTNLNRYYTWPRHIRNYLRLVAECPHNKTTAPWVKQRTKQFVTANHYLLCDIDNTLTGDKGSMGQLSKLINRRDDILFGIATGRSLESAQHIIKELGMPDPTLLITSVGTRIHYNFGNLTEDTHWRQHIRFRWHPEKIRALLADMGWLEMQEEEAQGSEKISYYLPQKSPNAARDIKSILRQHRLQARVVVSHDKCVDVLPVRASKGHALRFVSWRFGIETSQFVTAGDSGNDIDMLRGITKGIVVSNHSAEVKVLRRSKDVYFSHRASAAGILDGLKHYGVC
jgi:sucrose-phosphate synthase